MPAEELAYRPECEQDAARAWPAGLGWFLVAGLAWALFELTANPSLVAVVACLKFGWPNFHNGFWLWRMDHNKKRGRACFFFYGALAFWKISLTAVALTIGIVIVTSSLQLGIPGKELIAATMSLWIGCLWATIFTGIGCGIAWKGGLKIWVDSTVTWSRKHRIWPPQTYGSNKLHGLLLGAGLVGVMVALLLAIIIMGHIAFAGKKQIQAGWIVLGWMLGMILFAVGLLVVTEQLTKRICASHASYCWNPAEPTLEEDEVWLEEDEVWLEEDDFSN